MLADHWHQRACRQIKRLQHHTRLDRRVTVPAFRHVLLPAFLESSRLQIAASVTVELSGVAHLRSDDRQDSITEHPLHTIIAIAPEAIQSTSHPHFRKSVRDGPCAVHLFDEGAGTRQEL